MTKTFILIFLTTLQIGLSQTRKIVLLIDTIIPEKKGDFPQLFTFTKYSADSMEIENRGWEISKGGFGGDIESRPFRKYASYLCGLEIRDDSTKLRVEIDNFDSYIEVSNLYKLKGDTLRINKIELYPNCNCDTIFTTKNYIADSNKIIKTDYEKKFVKRKCKKPIPQTLAFILNGRPYRVSVQVVKSYSYDRWSNEHILTDKEKKGFPNSTADLYWFSNSVKNYYFNVIQIRLKNAL